jgi:hypothetical protein
MIEKYRGSFKSQFDCHIELVEILTIKLKPSAILQQAQYDITQSDKTFETAFLFLLPVVIYQVITWYVN